MRETLYRSTRICRVMGNPVTFRLVEILMERHWITPSALALKTHRAVSTISGHLKNLRQVDLVRYEGKGNQVRYRLKYPQKTRAILDALRKQVEISKGN